MWMQWCRRVWGRWVGREAAQAPMGAQPQAMRRVGAGNVQVAGSVDQLHTDHSRTVQVVQHVTHQHFYASAPAPMQAPPTAPPAANEGARLTPEQRTVFTAMQRLPRRKYLLVLDFMRREFDTGLVNQLNDTQLHRVRCYVQKIQRNEERERA